MERALTLGPDGYLAELAGRAPHLLSLFRRPFAIAKLRMRLAPLLRRHSLPWTLLLVAIPTISDAELMDEAAELETLLKQLLIRQLLPPLRAAAEAREAAEMLASLRAAREAAAEAVHTPGDGPSGSSQQPARLAHTEQRSNEGGAPAFDEQLLLNNLGVAELRKALADPDAFLDRYRTSTRGQSLSGVI